jgi:predicted ferric reductase
VSATVDPRLWWWVSRASGIVAWVVVTAAVVWGLLASTKLIRRRGVPAWILDLHRYLGTLTVAFVIVHVGAIYLDSFVSFSPKQLFVPLASSWRPHAVAWGIFATYLLLAIQLTSWAMRRLPRKLWHRVHMLSIPMLVLATVHGFLAGTDRSSRALQWTAFVILAGIVFLLGIRMLAPGRKAKRVVPGPKRESRPGRPVVVRDELIA